MLTSHARQRPSTRRIALPRLRLPPDPWTRRLAWSAALAAGFGLLVIYRFALTTAAFRNSDDASNFLAGAEMAQGNWLLHGWILAPDNYYLTDVLGQALLRLAFGDHPVFMQGLEALVWAAIGLLGTALALLGRPARHWLGTASLALALLVFNVFDHRFEDLFLSSIASHGFTILLALFAFTLALCPAERAAAPGRPRRLAHAALLGAVVTVGSVSDPIFKLIACLPILAVTLLGVNKARGLHQPLAPAGATLGGMALAHALLSAEAHNGGFQSIALSVTLATPSELADDLGFAAMSTIRLLGAAFFGRTTAGSLANSPFLYLLRVPLVLGFAVVCWEGARAVQRRLRDWPGGPPAGRGERLELLLWTSLVLCVTGTVVTTVITDQTCARFFIPSTVMGSILLARRFGAAPLGALYGGVVMLASLAVSIASLPRSTPQSTMAIVQVQQLVETLQRRGLRHGYAGFWEGAIVTALSRGAITSLALVNGDGGRLQTLSWFCNLDWYRRAARDWHGRTFFITSREPSRLELTQANVTREFGRPLEVIRSGQFEIDVYDLAGPALSTLTP